MAQRKTYFALLTGLILIGFSPILIKLSDAPGIITTFYRMVFGLALLTPVFVNYCLRHKPDIPVRAIPFALLAGFCLATDMSFWSTGIMASNATLPTLAGNLAPLWVGFGATIVFKEKLQKGFWAGLIISIVGMGLLMADDIFQPGATLKGIVFGFIAGFFYAGFLLFTQSGRRMLDTLTFLFISTLATALTSFIYALIFGLSFTGYPPTTWGYWIAMGVGIQFFAWFLINYVQGLLPAAVVAPTLLAQPVITAFLAIYILGERFTAYHMIGGIVIIAGIYVVHFSRRGRGS